MEEKNDKVQFILVRCICFPIISTVGEVHHGFSTTRRASDILVGHNYIWWSRNFIRHGELPGQNSSSCSCQIQYPLRLQYKRLSVLIIAIFMSLLNINHACFIYKQLDSCFICQVHSGNSSTNWNHQWSLCQTSSSHLIMEHITHRLLLLLAPVAPKTGKS